MVRTLTPTFLRIDLGIENFPTQAAHQPVNESAIATEIAVAISRSSQGPVIAISGSAAPSEKATAELQAAAHG